MLSCEEPGGLFATCELGNGALCAPFPDRARSLPREKVSCRRQDGGVVKPDTVTEGVLVRVSAFPLPPRRRKATLPCLPPRGPQKKTKCFFGVGLGVSKCFLAKSPAGSLPLANLETAHGACRFRAPAQMQSRCVGRGAARALPREKVPRRGGRSHHILASSSGSEQALSEFDKIPHFRRLLEGAVTVFG